MKTLNDIKNCELARFLGVTPSFISQAKNHRSNKKFSTDQAQRINEKFDVPLYEIRPDTYPKRLFQSKAA